MEDEFSQAFLPLAGALLCIGLAVFEFRIACVFSPTLEALAYFAWRIQVPSCCVVL